MLTGAAGDEPYMAVKGMLLAFGSRTDAAVADVLALLVDPEEIDIGIELIDKLEAGLLAGTLGLAQLNFSRGRFERLLLRQPQFFKRRCRFALSALGLDQHKLIRLRSSLHPIPERFAIRQPVGFHTITEDEVFGALGQAQSLLIVSG